MIMNKDELVRIIKDQCESIVMVLEKHAEETTSKDEMKSYKMMSLGKLRGIIDMTINIYASELVNDDNAYWEKVSEIRAYEDDIDAKLTEIYTNWLERYLNNV